MFFPYNLGRVAFMALNCLIPLIWVILSVIALLDLRQKNLNETARVLWAILVVCVPMLGAIAFWIVRPGGSDPGAAG
jgi:hypothetical protein